MFNEIELHGYKITGWSIGQLSRLAPYFEVIATRLKLQNFNLDSIDKQETGNIQKIIFAVLPEIVNILAITLREKKEVIEDWNLEKTTEIIFAIVKVNLEYLKNLSGRVSEIVSQIS